MLNGIRIGCGLQALGLAEASHQNAVAYAAERRQGRALGRAPVEGPADPILRHDDIRRMLMTQKAHIEGLRAFAGWLALQGDIAARSADPAARRAATDLLALLTPVVKAFGTECGFEATNLGLQVFGGHGYIRENGMEQFVRDGRISLIWDGTNGIQALDLIGRKLPARGGALVRRFFDLVAAEIQTAEAAGGPARGLARPLAKAQGELADATAWLAAGDPAAAAGVAPEYLRLFGLVTVGYLWLRMARLAAPRVGGEAGDFYAAKLVTAHFYMSRILPRATALKAVVTGGDTLDQAGPELFAAPYAA